GGGLDPSAGAAVGVPGFCLVAGLGKAAQTGFLVERAASANVVGSFIDQPVENGVAGQTEDEVDAILVAPQHDLRAAVMTVAADGDTRRRPVLSYAADPAGAGDRGSRCPRASCRGAAARRPDGLSRCRRCGSAESSARRNGH